MMEVMVVVAAFFFFNDTAPTEIYTLSLHDALPIYPLGIKGDKIHLYSKIVAVSDIFEYKRSEEHTSELQSHVNLVCRLLLEKKKIARLLIATRSGSVAPKLVLLLHERPRVSEREAG